MTDPITLTIITTLIAKNAPAWLAALRSTVLDKTKEVAIERGKDFAVEKGGSWLRSFLRLDEKEQIRHLQQALKNASERGLASIEGLSRRDEYNDVLQVLFQEGSDSDVLRHEALKLFTLDETPDFSILTSKYNYRRHLSNAAHVDIDITPYLTCFFDALITELYADPYFKQQMSDTLQLRASVNTQKSLLQVIDIVCQIQINIVDDYTAEQFAADVNKYTSFIERTLHNLKIVGVVPKDQNKDPELDGIYVPLRIAVRNQSMPKDQPVDNIIALLEQHSYVVLLGGPGSGKSTATRHLAWTHAIANQNARTTTHSLMLSGKPLPLRIELRRFNEERRHHNYNFLDYVSEVTLKREGINISSRMFEALLELRAMLLLFDGLDEVATLDERAKLVEEIEYFAICHPGNRYIVTSRFVGYQLVSLSNQLFVHAEVQTFNDEQIRQFLENWYTYVLGLNPLPSDDRQELETLYKTLQGNQRLHKLSENPLLLTAITGLHRYERLPDRRVLIYDRCADLLLETWAKLKGTKERWQSMKMIKEEQYACVAYLGFVLHERSQEELDNEKAEEETTDVSSRFLRKKVEEFLRKRKLIAGVAEQQAEAKRFIALVQEEAGLIVERGTDENGEALYSFVHRTFQEYFAAADVYERYQQAENPKVVSKFLYEHLHDPHWREVILLLLGKLKSTPVTNQLRQILQGNLKSLRSQYTEIVQQDLFFVCDCLVEEIKVEHSLVDTVISRLCNVIIDSPFPTQRQDALTYLGKLMQTRQYAGQGRKELVTFATKDGTLDVLERLEVMSVLYNYTQSEKQQLTDQALALLLQHSSPSIEQALQNAVLLYKSINEEANARQLAISLLISLLQNPELSVDQIWKTIVSLYRNTNERADAQKLATPTLISLLQRPELSIDQMRRMAEFLYESSPEGSDAERLATSTLSSLLQRSELSLDQIREVAESLYSSSPEGSDAERLATSTLNSLLQRPELSIDQALRTVASLYNSGPEGSDAQKLATSTLSSLLQRSDLSTDQVLQTIAASFYDSSYEGSLADLLAISLFQQSGLSFDQVRQTVASFYIDPEKSDAEQLVTSLLTSLLQRSELSVNQIRQTTESLYNSSPEGSDAEQLIISLCASLLQRPELSLDQIREFAESLYESSPKESDARQLATSTLTSLLQRSELSLDQIRAIAQSLYNSSRAGSDAERLATSTLSSLLQRPDLSTEQAWQIAESLYESSRAGSDAERLATSTLLALLSRAGRAKPLRDVYDILSVMVPQFHKLQPITVHL